MLLDVRGLRTSFPTAIGVARVVDDVSFVVRSGETVCVVGESGCGKTVTALSILRLLPPSATLDPSSTIVFERRDLTRLDPAILREVRGRTNRHGVSGRHGRTRSGLHGW